MVAFCRACLSQQQVAQGEGVTNYLIEQHLTFASEQFLRGLDKVFLSRVRIAR